MSAPYERPKTVKIRAGLYYLEHLDPYGLPYRVMRRDGRDLGESRESSYQWAVTDSRDVIRGVRKTKSEAVDLGFTLPTLGQLDNEEA